MWFMRVSPVLVSFHVQILWHTITHTYTAYTRTLTHVHTYIHTHTLLPTVLQCTVHKQLLWYAAYCKFVIVCVWRLCAVWRQMPVHLSQLKCSECFMHVQHLSVWMKPATLWLNPNVPPKPLKQPKPCTLTLDPSPIHPPIQRDRCVLD